MANCFFVGGISALWGNTANWSAVSGGAGGAGVPTAADDAFFDVNSPVCAVNSSPRVCRSLNFTGYTSTIGMLQQITVARNVTLSATMTITGPAQIKSITAGTWTSNGKAWPNTIDLSGAVTFTFADNWTVGGLIIGSSASSGNLSTTLNGAGISVTGNLNINHTGTGNCLGTALIKMAGASQTMTKINAAGQFRLPIEIAASGVVTIVNDFNFSLSKLKLTSGSVVTNFGSWATPA